MGYKASKSNFINHLIRYFIEEQHLPEKWHGQESALGQESAKQRGDCKTGVLESLPNAPWPPAMPPPCLRSGCSVSSPESSTPGSGKRVHEEAPPSGVSQDWKCIYVSSSLFARLEEPSERGLSLVWWKQVGPFSFKSPGAMVSGRKEGKRESALCKPLICISWVLSNSKIFWQNPRMQISSYTWAMGVKSVKQPDRSLISSHMASHGDIIFEKALNHGRLGLSHGCQLWSPSEDGGNTSQQCERNVAGFWGSPRCHLRRKEAEPPVFPVWVSLSLKTGFKKSHFFTWNKML